MTHRSIGWIVSLAALGLALAGSPASAQFTTGSVYAGPRIWLGNLNGALAIGAQVEKGITKPGDVGGGIISGGIGIDYYTWSSGTSVAGYKFSVIPIQVFSNYHFAIKSNPKVDPYLGLALVYSVVSSSVNGSGITGGASGSSAAFAGQGGVRYFLTEKFALQGQIGFGYGTIGLGVTWKF